jgi:hypothetical protein
MPTLAHRRPMVRAYMRIPLVGIMHP